ncbi:MAG: hypothetical protein K2M46_14440 [Lachnospiraceae bacterium]|nr:hypothetical protein [Lachnospiraceae bacterium]
MVEYIHYGHKEFSKEFFQPIKNREMFSKPTGGFWASKVNALYGWKDWCKDNEFGECEEDNSFRFSLSINAKIFTINSMLDLKPLPKAKQPFPTENTLWSGYLDFERLYLDNIDAIEVNISSDRRLYMAMYGWDCDSILIMNPDIVCVKED